MRGLGFVALWWVIRWRIYNAKSAIRMGLFHPNRGGNHRVVGDEGCACGWRFSDDTARCPLTWGPWA